MVFSFFKKPPPEKMVAKPAAAPPRPKAETPAPAAPGESADAQRPPEDDSALPAVSPGEPESLDFTTASDFGDLSETPGDIHVESDIDPIEAEIEQAAVLYANAQDDLARTMLEGAVQAHPYGPGERLWLMLFDLHRLTNRRAAFDALSLDYAKAFEKSPPAWRNAQPAKAAAKPAPAAAGAVLFKGELTGDNDAAFAALDQAVDKNPKLRVELGKVAQIDDLGAERLLGVLAKARKDKHEIELAGRDTLAQLIESRIETGRREESGCWLLLLELYQLMGRQDAFEEMAINYAVTFEMSPPSWEPKRVAAAEPKPVLALAGDAPDEDDGVRAYAPKGDLKAERFSDLQGFVEKLDPVVLDFSAVIRIDFISAGTLVNLLTGIKRKGKRILIRHPNHLVAELLGVVGLRAVADIEFEKI